MFQKFSSTIKKPHSNQSSLLQGKTLQSVVTFLDNRFVDALMCVALVFVVAVSPITSFAEDKAAPLSVLSISEKTNINSATAEQIAANLSGVGNKKAEAIIAWRSENGKFTTVDQLIEVKGIGVAIVDKNRDKISL